MVPRFFIFEGQRDTLKNYADFKTLKNYAASRFIESYLNESALFMYFGLKM